MSSNKVIAIGFQLKEEGNGMGKLLLQSADLRKIMESTATEAEKFGKSCVNFVALSNTFKAINDSLSG
ncbi:MAG: hypothetical protein K2M09_07225, partial [Muribaculaceae bacterium]|nr:hypothetical protein [Muribaculaceae bacterium]